MMLRCFSHPFISDSFIALPNTSFFSIKFLSHTLAKLHCTLGCNLFWTLCGTGPATFLGARDLFFGRFHTHHTPRFLGDLLKINSTRSVFPSSFCSCSCARAWSSVTVIIFLFKIISETKNGVRRSFFPLFSPLISLLSFSITCQTGFIGSVLSSLSCTLLLLDACLACLRLFRISKIWVANTVCVVNITLWHSATG